jgi:hypothetical protein
VRLSYSRLTAVALICLIGLIAGCSAGGGNDHQSNNGTPPGTYRITIEGHSDTLAGSTTSTLIVR